MRKALRRLLTGRGYRVEEYDCAASLLAAVGSSPPDCIILDLHLPGVNGFDVLDALGTHSDRVPVVVLTALDDPGTGERVRLLGASAHLKKPVDREALLSAIHAATVAPR